MPNPISEVDTFTPVDTLVAPDGDDFMDDAADVVELALQGLANRTHNLNQHVPLKDDAARSIFTVPIQGDTLNVRDPVIRSRKGPHDHPGKPANPWKEFLQGVNLGNGSTTERSSLYVGDGAEGSIGLVVNAQWREDISGGVWRQLDASKPSYFAHVNADGDLRYSKKAAGAPDWTAWDTSTVCVISAPGITGDFVQGNVSIYSLGPVIAGEGFAYPGSQSRTTPIRTTQASGLTRLDASGFLAFQQTIIDGEQYMYFPMYLPVGATLDAIRVRSAQASATGDRFSVMKRSNIGSGTLSVAELAHATANSTITTSPPDKVTTISSIGYVVLPGDELSLRWKLEDIGSIDALANNRIRGAEMDWTESRISYQ